jgi:hypothetical protein
VVTTVAAPADTRANTTATRMKTTPVPRTFVARGPALHWVGYHAISDLGGRDVEEVGRSVPDRLDLGDAVMAIVVPKRSLGSATAIVQKCQLVPRQRNLLVRERRTLDEATRALESGARSRCSLPPRLSRGLRWGAGNLTPRRGTEPTIKNPADDAANERCHPE